MEEYLQKIDSSQTTTQLEELRIFLLGKKGILTEKMKSLGAMSPEERKVAGATLNNEKNQIQSALDKRKKELEQIEMNAKLAKEKVDITLSTRPQEIGRIHPVSQAIDEMLTIFGLMGFGLAEGPDVEDDWHNFEALNIPPNHPARQMQATFFMKDGIVLRTQTSGVQIRTMENQKPPIKIVAPGRVYRCDYDATHTPMFHQIEGLVIDKETNLSHLKGVLSEFMKKFFETDDVTIRFRPSFFPFTEPSYELDIGGVLARNVGKDWLELGGLGMVHPNVLKNCGIDPNEYQGFAFGFGVDRCAMMKYGIKDLRPMFEGDLNWTKHYGHLPLDIPTITNGLSMNAGVKK